MTRPPPTSTLFPYTTLFRSLKEMQKAHITQVEIAPHDIEGAFSAVDIVDTSTAEKRSEEHTSELQSPVHLVCRLLLEKKKKPNFGQSRNCTSNGPQYC